MTFRYADPRPFIALTAGWLIFMLSGSGLDGANADSARFGIWAPGVEDSALVEGVFESAGDRARVVRMDVGRMGVDSRLESIVWRTHAADLNATEADRLREHLIAGRGLVIVATGDESGDWFDYLSDLIELEPVFDSPRDSHPVLVGLGAEVTAGDDGLNVHAGTAGAGRVVLMRIKEAGPRMELAIPRIVVNALCWTARREIPGVGARLERVLMPNAAPGAFAIGYSSGVNFCFDPVRGGLRYIWDGNYADLTPVRPDMDKFIHPVELRGPVVYRESINRPLRWGDPNREPHLQFRGWRWRNGRPEFHYQVDGVLVREIATPLPGGDLVRRFQVDGPAATWWYLLDDDSARRVDTAEGVQDTRGLRFEPGATGEFSLTVRVKGEVR